MSLTLILAASTSAAPALPNTAEPFSRRDLILLSLRIHFIKTKKLVDNDHLFVEAVDSSDEVYTALQERLDTGNDNDSVGCFFALDRSYLTPLSSCLSGEKLIGINLATAFFASFSLAIWGI